MYITHLLADFWALCHMWNALTYLYVTWLNIVTKYCHKYYIKLFFGTSIKHHILLKMAVCCLRKKSEIVKNNIIFLHFYKDKLYRSVAIWHLSYGQFHGRFNVNSDYNLQFLSNAALLLKQVFTYIPNEAAYFYAWIC